MEIEFLFFSCNIHTISFWNSFHFSVKDVTEIVTLLILILKLIAKFRECIRYFKRRGWQQDGGDGTTNNKMGIESDNSIVAPVKASTYAGNGVHHANRHSTLSHYYLEFHAFFLLLLLRLSSIRKHGDWWGVFFFDKDTSFSWGRYTILVDVVLWAQDDWTLFLVFSACPFFYALCFLNRLLLGCVLWFVLWLSRWLKFYFIHPNPKK